LEIALRALQIGPGDEVITVPFTWISTAEAIALVGAKPVFVDIEASTYNINADLIDNAISSRTKAIIAVDLFGQMADYTRINQLAAKHGIAVIADAAQSFGARQGEKVSGAATTVGSTSFFPAKPLGCYGDGGALFTDDAALAERMRAIRTHGGVRRHEHTLLGMNGRFDTLQAAVVLAKLPEFDRELGERRRVAAVYGEKLAKVCSVPTLAPGNTHVYAQYTIRVPDRNALALRLSERNIPTAVYYPKCLHEQPIFSGCGQWGDFPESEKASREVISLPMHPFLTEADQKLIIDTILYHFNQC
jgi:UDP-2-acetamido-2-deoxy-ribo-hexuluronate aminotransferase